MNRPIPHPSRMWKQAARQVPRYHRVGSSLHSTGPTTTGYTATSRRACHSTTTLFGIVPNSSLRPLRVESIAGYARSSHNLRHTTATCSCCDLRSHPYLPTKKNHRSITGHRNFATTTDNDPSTNDDKPAPSSSEDQENNSHHLDIPGAQKGGKKLAIVFTCTVCNTRSAKQFTENAYQKGVVLVQCPGCNNRHLIADNLGFFSDKQDGGWTIEKAMAEMGENVKVVNNENVLELSVEDIYGGEDAIQEAIQRKSGQDESEESSKTP